MDQSGFERLKMGHIKRNVIIYLRYVNLTMPEMTKLTKVKNGRSCYDLSKKNEGSSGAWTGRSKNRNLRVHLEFSWLKTVYFWKDRSLFETVPLQTGHFEHQSIEIADIQYFYVKVNWIKYLVYLLKRFLETLFPTKWIPYHES